jgi:serine/threonine protein kinase/tetratricopeptide (TPR) repeat protein
VLPWDSRADLLSRECGPDTELRGEVEALLASDTPESGLFVGLTGVRDAALRTVVESVDAPPATIGPFRVVEVVGQGGMGVVYRGVQDRPIAREVAIKVIKLGMESRQVIARFEGERQALAVMDHPNIAKVLDAGTTEAGRPYFAMELVRGEPITRYCDRCRIMLRQRLELFLSVCEAVQHAHHKGVIHRDIKPGNILVAQVEDRPLPKVIDFGISKAVHGGPAAGAAAHTEIGRPLGTPGYMSPEQAGTLGVDVDTRTDVYSLGIVLYELLAGVAPVDPGSLAGLHAGDLARIHAERDPPSPSRRLEGLGGEETARIAGDRGSTPGALRRDLRRDLEWIPLKAIRRDRDQRYASPGELAADIRRYLSGAALEAGPQSRIYLARSFVRRHRTPVAVGVTAILALTVGLWGTGIAWSRTASALRQTFDTLKRNEETNLFLRDILSAQGLADQGKALTYASVLERAERKLPSLRDPLANAYVTKIVAAAYADMEVWDRAEPLARSALAQFAAATGLDSPETLDATEAMIRIRVAAHSRDSAVFAEAAQQFESLYRRRVALEGPLSRGSLAAREGWAEVLGSVYLEPPRMDRSAEMFEAVLANMRRVLPRGDPLFVQALRGYAGVEEWRFRRKHAVELVSEAVDLLKGDPERESALIAATFQLANKLRLRGLNEEAEVEFREAIRLADLMLPEQSYTRWNIRHYYGRLLTSTGRFDEAERVLLEARAGMERFSWRGTTVDCDRALVENYIQTGRFDLALAAAERTWAAEGGLPQSVDGYWQAALVSGFAVILFEAGRVDEAQRLVRLLENCPLERRTNPEAADTDAFTQANIARVKSADGYDPRDEYIAAYRSVLEDRSTGTPAPIAWRLFFIDRLIGEYERRGDDASARAWEAERAHVRDRDIVGRQLVASGRLADAEAYLLDRWEVLSQRQDRAFARADTAVVIVALYEQTGRPAAAAAYRSAISGWTPPPIESPE